MLLGQRLRRLAGWLATLTVAAAFAIAVAAFIELVGRDAEARATVLRGYAFITFAKTNGSLDGQVLAFFVMVVAAAEVVVGLGILVAIFRKRSSTSVDDVNLLKG